MRSKIAYYLTLLPFIVISVVGALWVNDRSPPVETIRQMALNSPKPGETLTVEYEVFRIRQCAALIERTIFDGQNGRHLLPELERLSAGPIGHDSYRVMPRIPENAEPGPSRYRVTIAYRCNPLHTVWPITALAADMAFRIEPKNGP